jgi:hypothetical protein
MMNNCTGGVPYTKVAPIRWRLGEVKMFTAHGGRPCAIFGAVSTFTQHSPSQECVQLQPQSYLPGDLVTLSRMRHNQYVEDILSNNL